MPYVATMLPPPTRGSIHEMTGSQACPGAEDRTAIALGGFVVQD